MSSFPPCLFSVFSSSFPVLFQSFSSPFPVLFGFLFPLFPLPPSFSFFFPSGAPRPRSCNQPRTTGDPCLTASHSPCVSQHGTRVLRGCVQSTYAASLASSRPAATSRRRRNAPQTSAPLPTPRPLRPSLSPPSPMPCSSDLRLFDAAPRLRRRAAHGVRHARYLGAGLSSCSPLHMGLSCCTVSYSSFLFTLPLGCFCFFFSRIALAAVLCISFSLSFSFSFPLCLSHHRPFRIRVLICPLRLVVQLAEFRPIFRSLSLFPPPIPLVLPIDLSPHGSLSHSLNPVSGPIRMPNPCPAVFQLPPLRWNRVRRPRVC